MGEISKINMGGVDYDIRDKVLEEQLGNINAKPMISVTYAELVALRDNGELIAGMQYRITDYVTTTAQENTRSAGHQFDIIVTADNENTLNEVARACMHDGDNYFSEAGANLAAWQIWYSLDNDAERFAWADTENGKGVIYRMIDEWNNDLPYDFKNIKYVENPTFECSQYGMAHTYTKNGDVLNIDAVNYYGYTRTRTGQGPPPPPEVLYITDEMPTTNSIIYTIEGSVATPYTSATIDSVNQKSGEYYTFSLDGKEGSVSSDRICHSNIIRAYYENGLQQRLNKIVFAGTMVAQLNCHSNTFGYNCYSNSFGNDCHSNSFGNYCNSNIFGNNCRTNSFGNYCDSNTFGYNCHSNSFGNDCYYNSFGIGCHSNSFGNNCRTNSFGNDCGSNSFGIGCGSNSFGNYCHSNIFGNDCNYNSFGNDCGSLELNESTSNKTASVNSSGEAKVFNLADLADLLNS